MPIVTNAEQGREVYQIFILAITIIYCIEQKLDYGKV